VQESIQNLIQLIGSMFLGMFENAPTIMGSKYPLFFVELLILIVIFDLVIFGWRPLVRRFAPDHYANVDYIFGQAVNVLAFIVLVVFTFYLGSELGSTWGTWLGLSGIVWIAIGIIAVIFGGRYLTTGSLMGSRRGGNSAKNEG